MLWQKLVDDSMDRILIGQKGVIFRSQVLTLLRPLEVTKTVGDFGETCMAPGIFHTRNRGI